MTALRKLAPEKQLSRRVYVNITRDMTQTISKVVWQHELPLLEIIHGVDREGEDDDEVGEGMSAASGLKLVDPAKLDEGYKDKVSVELLPYNKKQDRIPRPSEAHRIGWVFVGSPRLEYQRLAGVYDKHPEVNVSNAEYIYGRFREGRFTAALGKPEFSDLPEAQLASLALDYGATVEQLAETSGRDALTKLCRELGVQLG